MSVLLWVLGLVCAIGAACVVHVRWSPTVHGESAKERWRGVAAAGLLMPGAVCAMGSAITTPRSELPQLSAAAASGSWAFVVAVVVGSWYWRRRRSRAGSRSDWELLAGTLLVLGFAAGSCFGAGWLGSVAWSTANG